MNSNGLDQDRSDARWSRVLPALLLPTLLIAFLLCGLSQRTQARSAGQAGENLVPNPGFETPAPASWRNEGSGPLCQYDWPGSDHHGGNASAGIRGYVGGYTCQWWCDRFAVDVGSRYAFSGWIKADNVSDKAFLTLAFYSSPSDQDPITQSDSLEATGSGGWITVTGSAVAPADAEYAQVHCKLAGQGLALFDDIYAGLVPTDSGQVYLPLALQNLRALWNGGFETGDFTFWTHDGELDQSVQSEITHEGNYAALLGNPDYPCRKGVPIGEGQMSQAFSVPSCPDPEDPELSFWYRIFSNDVYTDTKWDSFDVYIDGSLILRDGNVEWKEASCDREAWDSRWKEFSEDLSAYKGQNIQVSFHNTNRVDRYYNTWTYVDQVVVACEP